MDNRCFLEVPAQVIELRRYRLRRGQRDALITLFEREFVETQEAVGMQVLGSFTELGAADRFVWLRGFRDMALRPHALAAFYDGPVWQAHRRAANATMLDSDDVLLLRPIDASLALAPPGATRAPVGAGDRPPGLLTASIALLDAPAAACGLAQRFRVEGAPLLAQLGARVLAGLVTESRANNFPRLPVREGVHALVWLCLFDDEAAHRRHTHACAASPAWRDLRADIERHLVAPLDTLRLVPTPRSSLHARAPSSHKEPE